MASKKTIAVEFLSVVALLPVNHDGELYAPGEAFEVAADELAALLAVNAVQVADAPVAPIAPVAPPEAVK